MNALLLVSTLVMQQPSPGTVIPLWKDPAPLSVGSAAADQPSLRVFLAPHDMATGVAVVICPGGGYGFLADDHEGRQVAEFFNKQGIHAFVLKYRIVTKDRPGPLGKAPLLDVQRAIRFVRSQAINYKLNVDRTVGICGFSAGGHLASTAATHFDDGQRNSEDPIQQNSCRPDFCVLGYPVISMEDGITHAGSKRNLLGPKPDAELVKEFSNDLQVTDKTPPTFIFHTDADTVVKAENPIRFYLALRAAKVPAELHVFERGKHGVGLGNDARWNGGDSYTANWPQLLENWLKTRGLAKKSQ